MAKGSTLGTTTKNNVAMGVGAGTDNIALKIAPTEQQEAQALHLCWRVSMILAGAAKAEESLSGCATTMGCWCSEVTALP